MTSDHDHPDEHLPAPAFRAHLAWEVGRAARREARFGAPRPRPRRLRTAGLLVACLALGVAGNFASAQVAGSARRDSLLAAVQAQTDVVTMQLDLARAQLDLVRRRFSAGVVSAEESARSEAEFRAVESQAARLRLDAAEIQASALAPRDDLNAPRVRDRDFVTERLQIALTVAQQRLQAAEHSLAEAERRVRAGVETELSLGEAKVTTARAQAELTVVANRLLLRREFLEKGTAPDILEKRQEITQANQDLRIARQAAELAGARVQLVERQHAMGAVTELELMRAQVEAKERQLELSRLMTRLQRLNGTPRDQEPQPPR